MRRRSALTFGPGAASIILIVVVLSMSVLGILSLMNARNDERLTQRSAQVIASGYRLADAAERRYAELDARVAEAMQAAESDEAMLTALSGMLPEGMALEGREVSWEESDGFRTLECVAEVHPAGDGARLSWVTHRLTAVTEDIWD